MNNTLHTPGPWKHDATWGIIKHGKNEICALHSGNIANANLISAAPDLLSALERLLQISQDELDQSATHDGLVNCEALANARVAIAKAKGAA
jgi:hypothetical protein